MPPPGKPMGDREPRHHQRASGRDFDDDGDEPSNNLWVGNLPPDTAEEELAALFAKHGELDSVTTYAARNYAFVHFKRPEDAEAAKGALQGAPVRGNTIKIEFARPAKPGKNLWIGGISSSVTKEQLEDEFSNFGKIEDYKFLRDRNSALINYYKIDDAVAALKNMNGKRLGGEQIRVDYLRSQPSKRDWSDHHDARDGHLSNVRGMEPPEPLWMPPDSMRNFPEGFHHGHKRLPPPGVRRDGLPSKILWIGYPPSVQIDEQMLHNAMILFGEIEQIRSSPSRHYSLVEFRSTDEARRAKEGLQGRLFNDPRIQILFANNEFAPAMDDVPFIPGPRGPRPDMFFGEHPLGHMEYFGPGHPMTPSNFPGAVPPNKLPGSNMLGRPFAPQGFEPLYGGSEFFNDVTGPVHNFSDGNVSNPMAPNFRRLSPPVSGILSPAPGMRPPMRPLPPMWDVLDARNPKRARIDGPPIDDSSMHARRMGGQSIGDPYALHQPDRGAAGPGRHSPIGARRPDSGFPATEQYPAPSRDHSWRGIIAKGGTPVCHARCVPLGKGIESPFPKVINCSAKTGLDTLMKHYAEAAGFDIVFFLPDSEDDFASYTEFLRYLGLNSRAGVAKLDDGITLFLVPPSDFLTKVLNVSGPERLYGVVLKMPQQPVSAAVQPPQQAVLPPASQYADRRQPPTQAGYGVPEQYEDQTLQMEYNRVLSEQAPSLTAVGRPLLGGDESQSINPVPLDHVSKSVAAPPEVSLTPDLIATLASLMPTSATSAQISTSGPAQLTPSSSRGTPLPVPVVPDSGMPPQMWGQEAQASAAGGPHQEQTNHPPLMLGHQFGNQPAHLSQLPSYTNITNMVDPSGHVHGSTQVQDNVPGVQQAASVNARPFDSYTITSQAGQFSASQANQQNQLDAAFSNNMLHGMSQATEVSGALYATGLQQTKSPSSSQVQSGSVIQHQIVSPLAADKANTNIPAQLQLLQNALSGSAQGSSESEADKNQRYQSTLQFAASLLLQLQQQQQQAGAQAMQGSSNQQ